jgi:lysyl-tRNA synthetase, class II
MNEESERPQSELLADRRAKLERLRDEGIEPYPHVFPDRTEIAAVRESHQSIETGEETDDRYRVAGRLTARRGHGKASFLDLKDGTGQIQIQARVDELGSDAYEGLLSLDIGDIVGIEGTVFASKRGELSIRADAWELLSKSLRPPPEKFHGLEDVETRYRRRELDLMANEETRDLFLKRARAIAEVRRWFDERDFVEVETPVLQPLYGGALARPFTTHHNALDRDLYLRIATELYLKRLVVGGIEKVYELGKDFRNEGISHKHNPEFTMLEWYEAYADYNDIAEELEGLVSAVAQAVLGKTKIEREGETIDLSPPWRRVTLRDAIREETGIDVMEHPSREELARAMGTEADPEEGWGKLVDGLLSRQVEPKLIQPTFIVDYPVELSPFAKRHRSEEGLVERWEAFVGGIEISNAFTELNDPDEQRRRFEAQAEEIARGDEETQPYDETFVESLEQGMPPTGGAGLGIDRLVMILTGAKSLREVLLFPAMRQ